MTLEEQADYLHRCAQSGCPEDYAQEMLEAEMERRSADPTEALCAALRFAFRRAAGAV